MCNKPNAGRSWKKLWICYMRSALGPIKFKLLICVVVNTWCSEQIFLFHSVFSAIHWVYHIKLVEGLGRAVHVKLN